MVFLSEFFDVGWLLLISKFLNVGISKTFLVAVYSGSIDGVDSSLVAPMSSRYPFIVMAFQNPFELLL